MKFLFFFKESQFNNFQESVAKQHSRMSSADFSEGSDFVEGKSDVKINEYQAAWNVTNAIQVNIPILWNFGNSASNNL